MRVLLAFDKFKDALTARQACAAAANGLRANHPDWVLDLCPLTDGGEGFCDTLTRAAHGRFDQLDCSGPCGKRISASLGHVNTTHLPAPARSQLGLKCHTSLAVIEMAAVSGLSLLPPSERDPWHTSSSGTGELILAAGRAGVDAILLGVGGSATNDLGLGALAALGLQFLDSGGSIIFPPTPATWEKIVRIDRSPATIVPPIFIACDVTNPLLGSSGATTTFGLQKGLSPADLPRLEAEMSRMAALLCEANGKPLTLADTPGAGAAGGIAFGLVVAAGARIVPGFDLVSAWLNLSDRIAAADLVLTGEGRFDATSLSGKGPGSIVAAARHAGKAAHVFAGKVEVSPAVLAQSGAVGHTITPEGMPLDQATAHSAELLTAAVTRQL